MSNSTLPSRRTTITSAVAFLSLIGCVAALVALIGTQASAAPSTAAEPSAQQTQTDGQLRWTIAPGSASDGSFVQTAAQISASSDPATCGATTSSASCIVLRVDGLSRPNTSSPCAHAGSSDNVDERCQTAGLKNFRLVASSPSPDLATDVRTAPADAATHTMCSSLPITIEQNGSNGLTSVRDGCREIVVCGPDYVGRIDADSQDTISSRCQYVSVDGGPTSSPPGIPQPCPCPGRGGSSEPPENRPPSGPVEIIQAPSSDAGAARVKGSQRYAVVTMVRARNAPHAIRAAIRLTSGSSLSVLLQRRTRGGKFVTVAKRATESPPGIKHVTFPRHGRATGVYRIGVRVPSNPRAVYVSRSVRRR